MRRLNHLTPRYIFSRFLYWAHRKRNPDTPWLTQDAINLLSQLIHSSDIGVEFGSGSSTKWLAERCAHFTSIENDEKWYGVVSRKLKGAHLTDKVELRLCITEKEYTSQILNFDDKSLDFCLVDGKFNRHKIAIESIKKIKKGGILIIDNVNWFLPNTETKSPDSLRSTEECSESWKSFYRETYQFRRVWTSNGVTDTAIFFVP